MKWVIYILLCVSLTCHSKELSFQTTPSKTDAIAQPTLPDVSQYNVSWVKNKLPARTKPSISIKSVFEATGFQEFTVNMRAIEWVKRQEEFPKVISIESGVATLDDILKVAVAYGDDVFIQTKKNTYLSRLPISIDPGATLIIDGSKNEKTLLLSLQKGSMMINSGDLFIINSQLIAWDEQEKTHAKFISDEEFRPFLAAFGDSHTYLADSNFISLGYFSAKTYGIVISSNSKRSAKYGPHIKGDPKAWIINNYFEKNYYGFYCYETNDAVIVGNTYFDNIVYGIDPHDYSERLLIANNDVSYTREKHGIIVSRSVNNSWIFNNHSHHNKKAGFMLDRQSNNNIIAYNEAHHNGTDGISIYESYHNLIYGNVFFANSKHGMRIRNSTDITSAHNIIQGNNQKGIFLYTTIFKKNERDLIHDPYTPAIEYKSLHDQLLHNQGGVIESQAIYPIYLANMHIQSNLYDKPNFTGALAPYNSLILKGLYKDNHAVSFSVQEN